jgi:threonine/homoserine/homoserine lactone efflux protein
MSLLAFLFESVLISLSGVMAPGPLTTVTVGKGNESPHAGAFVAIGHGIVEFPLMFAILYGAGRLLGIPYVKAAIASAGGLFLLLISIDMFRSIKRKDVRASKNTYSPLVAGILLSIGNPYFLVWWGTVGATLILQAVNFGFMGFLVFALLHWSCDFFWDCFLSVLSYKGGEFFGRRFQKVVFLVCGVFLLFFGVKFMVDGLTGFFA